MTPTDADGPAFDEDEDELTLDDIDVRLMAMMSMTLAMNAKMDAMMAAMTLMAEAQKPSRPVKDLH